MKRFVILISCLLCVLALLVGLYYAGLLYLTPASQTAPAYVLPHAERFHRRDAAALLSVRK